MKVLLLFILNLTGHSFAAPIEDEQMDLNLPLPCVEHSSDGFLDWVEAVQDRLVDRPWHSVQASMVEKAPCRRKRSLDNILKELADIQGVGKDYPDAEVRGLRFKGQNPALVTAFRDLVTKTNFLGEDLPEKKQENLEKAKDCSDVICAARAVFGGEIGPRLLYLRQQYGMNASDLAAENRSRPYVKELDSFIRAMDDLPPHFIPLKKNYPMTRFQRGYTLKIYATNDGTTTVANATMAFFDAWGDMTREGDKDRVCTHELGHVVGKEFNIDSSPEWLALSGWENRGKGNWKASKPEAIMSEYGNSNPDEDFAEAFTAYRYNPAGLKKTSPEKYEFLKKHIFAGLEYFQQSQCNIAPPRLTEAKANMNAFLSKPEGMDFPQIKQNCAKALVGEVSKDSGKNATSVNSCVANFIASRAITASSPHAAGSELDQKTLAKHISFAQQRQASSLVPQELSSSFRDRIFREFQEEVAKGLQGGSGSELSKSDCERFADFAFLSSDLSDRYHDTMFRISIRDFLKSVGSAYCEYHRENYAGARSVNPHDALYFTSKALSDKFQFSGTEWKKVEELRNRRARLLRELGHQSTLERARGFIFQDPRTLEVKNLEGEIDRILLGR